MSYVKKLSSLIILVAIFIFAFSSITYAGEIQVYTSVFPVYDLAEKIAGDDIDISLVVPAGAEIHSYEPSPRQIARLEEGDLFLYIGENLVPWTEGAVDNLEQSPTKTVKLSEELELIKYGEEHHHGHEEDHHHDHDHGVYDPHVWLDPINMEIMGERIMEEFINLRPEREEAFRERYENLRGKLRELDQEYQEGLQDRQKDHILVSHAAFNYLAERYELKQLSVSGIAPHAEPSPGAIAELIDLVEKYEIEYIFKEKLASPQLVEVLADEADLEVLLLDPVAGLTAEEEERGEDYFSLMYNNLENLKKALVD